MNISEYKGDASGTTISSWRIHPSGCVIVDVYVPGDKLYRYLYVSAVELPSPCTIIESPIDHVNWQLLELQEHPLELIYAQPSVPPGHDGAWAKLILSYSGTIVEIVSEQPLESITITLYSPDGIFSKSSAVDPLDQ